MVLVLTDRQTKLGIFPFGPILLFVENLLKYEYITLQALFWMFISTFFSRLTDEFCDPLNDREWEDDECQPRGQEAKANVDQELEAVEDSAGPLDQGEGAQALGQRTKQTEPYLQVVEKCVLCCLECPATEFKAPKLWKGQVGR